MTRSKEELRQHPSQRRIELQMAPFKKQSCIYSLLAALLFLAPSKSHTGLGCRTSLTLARLLRARHATSDVAQAARMEDSVGDSWASSSSSSSRIPGDAVSGPTSCQNRIPANGSLAERSTCPWVYGFDEDGERQPRRMVKAIPCTYNCIKVVRSRDSQRSFSFGVCEPIFWTTSVRRRQRNRRSGLWEMASVWEKMPVAFTCAFPKKQPLDQPARPHMPVRPTSVN